MNPVDTYICSEGFWSAAVATPEATQWDWPMDGFGPVTATLSSLSGAPQDPVDPIYAPIRAAAAGEQADLDSLAIAVSAAIESTGIEALEDRYFKAWIRDTSPPTSLTSDLIQDLSLLLPMEQMATIEQAALQIQNTPKDTPTGSAITRFEAALHATAFAALAASEDEALDKQAEFANGMPEADATEINRVLEQLEPIEAELHPLTQRLSNTGSCDFDTAIGGRPIRDPSCDTSAPLTRAELERREQLSLQRQLVLTRYPLLKRMDLNALREMTEDERAFRRRIQNAV